jgi:hypothetical protein
VHSLDVWSDLAILKPAEGRSGVAGSAEADGRSAVVEWTPVELGSSVALR